MKIIAFGSTLANPPFPTRWEKPFFLTCHISDNVKTNIGNSKYVAGKNHDRKRDGVYLKHDMKHNFIDTKTYTMITANIQAKFWVALRKKRRSSGWVGDGSPGLLRSHPLGCEVPGPCQQRPDSGWDWLGQRGSCGWWWLVAAPMKKSSFRIPAPTSQNSCVS